MSSKVTDVWAKRWDALKQMLQDDHNDAKDAHRYETLKNVRRCLYVFGRNHYDFFKGGFEGDNAIRLEPSSEYPKEYVLSTILQQISFDLDVIGRAVHYRLPTALREARETLDKADILAYTALTPAIQANLLPDMTVVTYFQKSVTARLTPYARITLIGIPFTATDTWYDLLAIPHEVGHYVYRHGVCNNGSNKGVPFADILSRELAGQPQWLLNWVEEIFADIYGCLVAGPVIARSFHEMQTVWSQEDFMKDDGEHPIGALRPYVYHQVLKHKGFSEPTRIALEKAWASYLAARQVGTTFLPDKSDKPIEFSAAKAAMDQVIQLLMNDYYLGSLFKANSQLGLKKADSTWAWAWDSLQENDSVDRLYENFTSRVNALSTDVAALVPELVVEEQSVSKQRAKPILQKPGATGLWSDTLKAYNQKLPMPPETWIPLLNANGWATEGPTGGNAH